MKITIPLVLTLIRLVIAPVLMPALLLWFLPDGSVAARIVLVCLFVALSATDFFDGFFARKHKQESLVGKLLDPLADKLFLIATMIALVSIHYIPVWWVILMIARDVCVMGFREMALTCRFSIPVSLMAKTKTAAQMLYLAVVIACPLRGCFFWLLQFSLLWISAVLTVASAIDYGRSLYSKISQTK